MLEENSEEIQEQDSSEGYTIQIHVSPNGYQIDDEPDMIESEADLLKHILAILKERPVEPSEDEGFAQAERER